MRIFEVVLPRSVANAQLKTSPRSTGRAPDTAELTFYVDDKGIRRLGKTKSTSGDEVDLSKFDGPPSNDPFSWSSSAYNRAGFEGKTVHGWDKHSYKWALQDASPGDLRNVGVAPYVMMKLKDGTLVRGWLTPDGNVK